jgi:hypothetical protein
MPFSPFFGLLDEMFVRTLVQCAEVSALPKPVNRSAHETRWTITSVHAARSDSARSWGPASGDRAFIAYYNFCWRPGKMRITPAMAARVTDRFWTFADLVAELEAVQV